MEESIVRWTYFKIQGTSAWLQREWELQGKVWGSREEDWSWIIEIEIIPIKIWRESQGTKVEIRNPIKSGSGWEPRV